MKRTLVLYGLGVLAAILFLSSCFYPETFTAKLNIDKNGSYSFVFDGTLVFLTFEQPKDEPLLTDQDPVKIRQLEEQLKNDNNFKEIKYTGKGRFKVLYRQEGVIKPGSKITLMANFCEIIRILPSQPGTIIINGVNLDELNLEYLKKMNVHLQGKLAITTNARVIRHNADRSPWFFGFPGAYEWQFTWSPFPGPWMLLELK
jgi:hypothetical protein